MGVGKDKSEYVFPVLLNEVLVAPLTQRLLV